MDEFIILAFRFGSILISRYETLSGRAAIPGKIPEASPRSLCPSFYLSRSCREHVVGKYDSEQGFR